MFLIDHLTFCFLFTLLMNFLLRPKLNQNLPLIEIVPGIYRMEMRAVEMVGSQAGNVCGSLLRWFEGLLLQIAIAFALLESSIISQIKQLQQFKHHGQRRRREKEVHATKLIFYTIFTKQRNIKPQCFSVLLIASCSQKDENSRPNLITIGFAAL